MNTLAQRDSASANDSAAYLIPVVDIASSGDAYTLQVEMPGVDKRTGADGSKRRAGDCWSSPTD